VRRGLGGPSPPRPLLAVPNVTAHPSTASVPITVIYSSYQISATIAEYATDEFARQGA